MDTEIKIHFEIRRMWETGIELVPVNADDYYDERMKKHQIKYLLIVPQNKFKSYWQIAQMVDECGFEILESYYHFYKATEEQIALCILKHG